MQSTGEWSDRAIIFCGIFDNHEKAQAYKAEIMKKQSYFGVHDKDFTIIVAELNEKHDEDIMDLIDCPA
jgi:hypothetical protein